MGNSKMIEAFVADHREEFLSILEHVVNLESHTYGARETKNRCGLYLKELFEGLGFSVGTMDSGGWWESMSPEPMAAAHTRSSLEWPL